MTVLALDAMGVIYTAADDVAELLCPFIRERGGVSEDAPIEALYREASLGRVSANEFWRRVNLDHDVEESYLQRHMLSPGVIEFLRAEKPGISAVWCLSNDVSEWSLKLRKRFGLLEFFDGWVISGDVGTRKPDAAIFRSLLERARCAAENVVFVDDRLANLDAAASLGLQTVWFNPGNASSSSSHRTVASFRELSDLICETRVEIT